MAQKKSHCGCGNVKENTNPDKGARNSPRYLILYQQGSPSYGERQKNCSGTKSANYTLRRLSAMGTISQCTEEAATCSQGHRAYLRLRLDKDKWHYTLPPHPPPGQRIQRPCNNSIPLGHRTKYRGSLTLWHRKDRKLRVEGNMGKNPPENQCLPWTQENTRAIWS